MTGTVDVDAPGEEERRSFSRSVLVWAVGLVLTLLVLVLLLRIFIRPIPPGQEAPLDHVGEPCWGCHLVTESADPVELP